MKAIRVVLGLLAATLATPVAMAAVFLVRWRFEAGGWANQPWPVVQDRILLYAMLSAPVALFLTLGFGAPLTHRRAERGRATALRTALTGAALGAMPFRAPARSDTPLEAGRGDDGSVDCHGSHAR